ncbi:MAG: 3-deoxy-8-phosphooctulonate synthase [Elusimicrobiota bacterium]|jgi:2-dehydro-3-deoxyphosphooctonate aldolase (KDO 8-P synthase)
MKTKPVVSVELGHIRFSNEGSLALIAGPCVIEDSTFTVALAKRLARVARERRISFVFKASYDKANRSSGGSFRGPGLERGLATLRQVKEEVGCPVLTDVHCANDVARVAQVVDVIQVPAFLCRQTDLLLACGESGCIVNVKKGQFLAPWDMEQVVRKIESTGNRKILLTERGISFGYNNLVVDMRSLAVMKQFGYPVIYDATHSVQLPGGLGHASGGQREYLVPLARAAVAVGIAAVFCEVHPLPEKALSDGPNNLPLAALPRFVRELQTLDKVAKSLHRYHEKTGRRR